MAGSQLRKQQLDEANAEVKLLKLENEELKRKLALVAPELLAERHIEPITEYDPKVQEVIQALADEGMGESEWIASFGTSQKIWGEWTRDNPSLADAVSRAKARHLAWWDRQSREAMLTNNTRFPITIYQAIKNDALAEAYRPNAEGHASQLVHVAFGKEGRNLFSRKPKVGP